MTDFSYQVDHKISLSLTVVGQLDKKDSMKREHQPVSRRPSQTPPDSPSHYFPLAASPLPLAGGIRLNKHLHHHPPPLPPLSPPFHQLQSLWSPQVSEYPLPTPSSIQILHRWHSKRAISMTVCCLKIIHKKIPFLSSTFFIWRAIHDVQPFPNPSQCNEADQESTCIGPGFW